MSGDRAALVAIVIALAASCGSSGEPPPGVRARPRAPEAAPEPEEQATRAVKAYVDRQVAELAQACEAICAAAPEPDADGWSIDGDRERVEAMRAAWRRARAAYERIEGAIAILFPETDQAIDGRYEHVVELRRDDDPFDGAGFVGLHAIERILWSNSIPAPTVTFERALPGYAPPRTPASDIEARIFREGLCARLVRDVREMERALGPVALDHATAWRGIVGSIEEQAEKVLLARTGEDESRYAEHTLADMRANLAGGRAVLEAFAPMFEAHPEAAAQRGEIERRLAVIERAYAEIEGEGLPPVPDAFDPDAPCEAHLATPYGRLFALLSSESDPRREGSLAAILRSTGERMGIPPLSR